MSTIGALPGLGGASGIAGLLRTVVGGGASGTAGSLFGPAFALGGSSGRNIAAGLYNALGQSLNRAGTSRATFPSAKDERRIKALRAAAAKIDAGDVQGGRAEAQALLDRNPQDPAALAIIARSYVSEQDYAQAERFYSRAAALSPSSTRLRNDVANVRTLQKTDNEVIRIARQKLAAPATRTEGLRLLFLLTERSPDNVDAYLALADGFQLAGKPVQVLGSLQEALPVAEGEKLNQVIERAQAFVQQYSEVGLGHNILGRALQKAGRLDEGLRELKVASEIASDNQAYANDVAGGYVERAAADVEAGKLSSAKSDLSSAFAINPLDTKYREVAARLSLAQADREMTGFRYSRALLELNRAYSAAPDDESFRKHLADSYARVARYYQNKGDDSVALTAYEKAYELDPDSTFVRRNMAQLSYEKGIDYRNQGDYVKAIEDLDRAYQADRTNDTYRQDLAIAYDLRGQELERQGELNDAIENYEKGFLLDPTNTSLGTNLSAAVNERDGS